MADINTDVLIIGGGVAGSAAACAFSKKGYEVLSVSYTHLRAHET